MFGSFVATTQFFLFGKRHCTASGWRRACAKYDVAALEQVDLKAKVCVVTGANSGLGKCLAEFLAKRGATVYMVCRNAERAEKARLDVVASSGNELVRTVLADVSRPVDVQRVVQEVDAQEPERGVDVLVCNAGGMTKERTLTDEGVEVTLATQLVFGSYLLTVLATPLLRRSRSRGGEPRVLLVSSGGMYTTKFPSWAEAMFEGPKSSKYSQEKAYTYAKRGQVLLAERLAPQYEADGIKVVSCHPGWVDTPGVAAWLGKGKAALSPLRTPWEGTEGMAWLCAAKGDEIQGGEFYLDRSPQPKHLAGAFFSEGSYTKNTDDEVQALMDKLADLCAPYLPAADAADADAAPPSAGAAEEAKEQE